MPRRTPLIAPAIVAVLFAVSGAASAGPREDCLNLKGEAAIRACDQAIKSNPRDAASYGGRAAGYAAVGNRERALADYAKAIELDAKKPGNASLDAYTGRAGLYSENRENDRAIADFSKAIAIAPNNARVYTARGMEYADKRDYERAIADYSQAIKINPQFLDPYVMRAIAHKSKGDIDRAVADYTQAIEIDPKADQAYAGRAHIRRTKGDNDGAIADYTKAIEVNKSFYFNYQFRGSVRSASGDLKGAIADFTKGAELDPKSPAWARFIGYAHFDAGDFKTAAGHLQKAIDIEVDVSPVLYRYLALTRSGVAADAELQANATRIKAKQWPYPLVEMYLGRQTPTAALNAAASPEDKCEANFFIGAWHSVKGRKSEAEAGLKTAVATCPKDFIEYASAIAELKRLKP